MAIGSFISNLVGFVFDPLLTFDPFIVIMGITLVVSLFTTLITKYFTDQNEMKALKTEIKVLQTQLKNLKNDPTAAMSVQKKAMSANLKYMSHSFRITFFTLIPLLLIYSWLGTNLAYQPLYPHQEFVLDVNMMPGVQGTVKVTEIVPSGALGILGENEKTLVNSATQFGFRGPTGEYTIGFEHEGKTAYRQVIVSQEQKYASKDISVPEPFQKISISYQKLSIIKIGSYTFGWLFTYIVFSIIFTSLLRKILNVY